MRCKVKGIHLTEMRVYMYTSLFKEKVLINQPVLLCKAIKHKRSPSICLCLMNLVVGRISIALQHKLGNFEKGTFKTVISYWDNYMAFPPSIVFFFNHVQLVFFLCIVLLVSLVLLLASGEQHNLQTILKHSFSEKYKSVYSIFLFFIIAEGHFLGRSSIFHQSVCYHSRKQTIFILHKSSFRSICEGSDYRQKTTAMSLTSLWGLGRKVNYYLWPRGVTNRRQ